MSRSIRGSKGCGYDYWGKRALSQCSPGRTTKKITLGIERARERQLIYEEVQCANSEDFAACQEEISRAVSPSVPS